MSDIKIVNVEELCWEAWQHGAEYGSEQKHLGDASGCEKIGVTMERLAPGKKSCVAHFHTKEEEHIYGISGQAVLMIDGQPHEFSAGDYICFRANTGLAHSFINDSAADFVFMVMGNRDKNDVVVYPENNKVQVRALDEIYVREPSNYWDPTE